MKPNDNSILEAEAVEATVETGKEPEPAVSLTMAASPTPYEVVITAAELRAMLAEIDPWYDDTEED